MALSLNRLTLLVAMQAEAQPLIERLQLQPADAPWRASRAFPAAARTGTRGRDTTAAGDHHR